MLLDTKVQTNRYVNFENTRQPRTDHSVQVGWNTRDLLLYAVGIGAKHDDFSLAFGASDPPFYA